VCAFTLELLLPLPHCSYVDGAIPILCKANSAIIFDRRLWHSATPNYSTTTRHATFVGYGYVRFTAEHRNLIVRCVYPTSISKPRGCACCSYRWLMPKEAMYVEPALTASSCPIRSQLLGLHDSNAHLFSPSASLPLAAWLRSIGVDTETTGFDILKTGPKPVPVSRMVGDIGHATFPRNEQSVPNIEAGGPVEVTLLPPSSDVEINSEEYASHRLTQNERTTLLNEGYLALGAGEGLGSDEVSELLQLLATVGGGKSHQQLPIFSQATPALQESTLVTRTLVSTKVLPKVCDALGWNIHMNTAFALYPGAAAAATWGRLDGQLCAEIATAGVDLPCLGLVAVYSLQSSTHGSSAAGQAATITVLPRSHRM
jgi:hypothetical protein